MLTTLHFATGDGAPIATLVNYACHPTASGPANTEVSRDWCGYAADAVEAALGGVAVYMNGAVGDVNPAADGGFEQAASLGEAVARAAVASLDASEAVERRRARAHGAARCCRCSSSGSPSACRTPSAAPGPRSRCCARRAACARHRAALHAAGRSDLAQMVAALEGINQRKMVQRDGRTYLPTHCGYMRIGDNVEGFAAPGEVLSRLSRCRYAHRWAHATACSSASRTTRSATSSRRTSG